MADPVRIQGMGRTVGAQTITLCSLTAPANAFGIVAMRVGGLSLDGLAGGATRRSSIKKVGGVLTNLGDFEALVLRGDAGLAGVAIQPAFNNGAIELQVTGVAGKTIDWTGTLEADVHVTPA